LIGRAPIASASAAPEPRLITIADDKDISRSHLRVAVDGDVVVVTDLASKNGTVVTLPGGSPRKLRGGDPTVVLPGTLIDLGGGVTFWVRED
jgi:pSer/pThr/pTyr-binding forkhead associated (FHA) protein